MSSIGEKNMTFVMQNIDNSHEILLVSYEMSLNCTEMAY